MSFDILPHGAAYDHEWDSWCKTSHCATFLHTRRFLGYHKERFFDTSAIITSFGRWVGVFPAARASDDDFCIISHPGATYGGIVHNGGLGGERLVEALLCLKAYYAGQGYRRLIYKPLPFIYAVSPAQDDLYALFRSGGSRFRCDLSSAIDLSNRRPPSKRRQRNLKKASRTVTVKNDQDYLADFWTVLVDNLRRKHNAQPVHSFEEIQTLCKLFPNEIRLISALIDNRVIAGVVLFLSSQVWHAQYIASSVQGYEVSALDLVFETVIGEACKSGARYFDFGTSNEDQGRVLNEGLYRFKAEFGGGGVAYEHYELSLCDSFR